MIEILEIVILVFVGLAAGVINTLAGGGAAFTLPVLIFLGLLWAISNGGLRQIYNQSKKVKKNLKKNLKKKILDKNFLKPLNIYANSYSACYTRTTNQN